MLPLILKWWMFIVVIYNLLGALLLMFKPDFLEHLFPRTQSKTLLNDLSRRILICFILTFLGIRIACFIDLENTLVFWTTYWTFLVWLFWNFYEIFIVQSTTWKSLVFGIRMGIISLTLMTLYKINGY